MALTKVTMGLLSGLVDKITTIVRSLFNVSGDAPMFACRAWVRFSPQLDTTGTSSTAATDRLIYASGNVSRVTRLSVGVYEVFFETPMPHVNYCTSAHSNVLTSGNDGLTNTVNSVIVRSRNSVLALADYPFYEVIVVC